MFLQLDSSIWSQLADKGLTILILALGLYFVWKQLQKQSDKMDVYRDEDRKEMLQAINNSNKLIENNTQMMADMKEFMQEVVTKHIS